MKIESNRDVLVFACCSTIAACAVVTPVIVLLYPPEDWRWELSLSLTLTVTITMSLCTFIGRKMMLISILSGELQRLVARDRLTDVATRDYFYSRMAEAPDSFGVSLMVDIDHFKRVNDTHGHIAGDAVIRRVAKVLQDMVGADDLVCRFGGEEFVIFLHRADITAAQGMAERLRRRVAKTVVSHLDVPLTVTVSIGGSLQAKCAEIDAAIHQADEALYQAKSMGRNRVVFYADAATTQADVRMAG